MHDLTIEQLLDSFEKSWHAGDRPSIAEIWTQHHDKSVRLLTELVMSELELRLKSGDDVRVEEYFEQFPEIANEPREQLAIVKHEWVIRSHIEPGLDVSELLQRFPALADQLSTIGFFFGDLSNENNPSHRSELRTAVQSAFFSRYELIEVHKEGGLGRVWIAKDRLLDRKVAIKEVKSKNRNSQELHQRLEREALITGNLQHPGIVPIHDRGWLEDGSAFYTMKFVEGETLSNRIREFHGVESPNRLEQQRLLRHFIDVCETIHYAHCERILHRDIKPQNIVVGEFGETVVLDWGLAKRLGAIDTPDDNETRTVPVGKLGDALNQDTPDLHFETTDGQVVGTPGYMSPEQARGEIHRLDPTSDVYSLGVLLFQLLFNKLPGDGAEAATSKIQPLLAVANKAMAPDSSDRFESAHEMALEIERFLADQPVKCRPESLMEKGARFFRNNTRLVATAVSCLVALTAVAAIANTNLSAVNQRLKKEVDRYAINANNLTRLYTAISRVPQPVEPLLAEMEKEVLAIGDREPKGSDDRDVENDVRQQSDMYQIMSQLAKLDANYPLYIKYAQLAVERNSSIESPDELFFQATRKHLANAYRLAGFSLPSYQLTRDVNQVSQGSQLFEWIRFSTDWELAELEALLGNAGEAEQRMKMAEQFEPVLVRESFLSRLALFQISMERLRTTDQNLTQRLLGWQQQLQQERDKAGVKPADDRPWIKVTQELAKLYFERQQFEQAVICLAGVVELLESKFGQEKRIVLQQALLLSEYQSSAGQTSEAIESLRERLERCDSARPMLAAQIELQIEFLQMLHRQQEDPREAWETFNQNSQAIIAGILDQSLVRSDDPIVIENVIRRVKHCPDEKIQKQLLLDTVALLRKLPGDRLVHDSEIELNEMLVSSLRGDPSPESKAELVRLKVGLFDLHSRFLGPDHPRTLEFIDLDRR